MLADALMGLGVSPLLAARTATGGTGPLTILPIGTTFATAAKLGASQFLCTASLGAGSSGIALPTVGSDNGALLADDYIINNSGTDTIKIFSSTGVTISAGATLDSVVNLGVHTTITLYPVSTTKWIGVKGS